MNYEEFSQFVKDRRSLRRYGPGEVPEEVIRKLLDVARYAPSGANTQPWEFIVIRSKDTIRKLAEFFKASHHIAFLLEQAREEELRHPGYRGEAKDPPWLQAAVLVVVLGDFRVARAYPLSASAPKNFYTSLANCVLLMHLTARTLGLTSQYITASSAPYMEAQMKRLLHIPAELSIYETLAFGYPPSGVAEPRARFVKELEDLVHHESFDPARARSDEQVREYILRIFSGEGPARH